MHSLSHNKTINIVCVINAAIHAIQHCIITTPAAYLPPSSLFIDAIAAIHDICINSSKFGVDGCVKAIKDFLELEASLEE